MSKESPSKEKNDSVDNTDKKKESSAKTAEKSKVVSYNKDVDIYFDEPLTHLNKGNVKAYVAKGQNNFSEDMVAYVCDKGLTPRRYGAIKYMRVNNINLLRLYAANSLYVPFKKKELFCMLYENVGRPLIQPKDKNKIFNYDIETILRYVVVPVISALKDIRDKDFFHGAVWPGNMYIPGNDLTENVKLGECLILPCGYETPSLYEPIERALATPLGKGDGSIKDDLYSFGVSLAVLLRSVDMLAGLSDEEVIERKIERGSYSALIGTDRLSGAMLELLRGLLHDDINQRWGIEDVEAWMDGRRLSPKQPAKRIKANRPIVFNQKKYIRPELLAKDLYKNPNDALLLVQNEELFQWLERAIENKSLLNKTEEMHSLAKSYKVNADYNAQLSALLSCALYTHCPIRYKEESFSPTAIGKMLSHAFAKDNNIQVFSEILRYPFVIHISQTTTNGETSGIHAKLDSCRAFLSQQIIGMGLERCLYFLDTESPCLSPLLKRYYITTPESLLLSLDKICKHSKPKMLMDRHIAAFIAVKDKRMIEPYFKDLRSSKPHRQKIGLMATLAQIQSRENIESCRYICEWFAGNITEIYATLNDAERVKLLKKEVTKLKKTGNIGAMVKLFDNPALYEHDETQYYKAGKRYIDLDIEYDFIQEKLEDKNYGFKTGAQVATVISITLSIILILGMVYGLLLR